jgi:hypothetical protein
MKTVAYHDRWKFGHFFIRLKSGSESGTPAQQPTAQNREGFDSRSGYHARFNAQDKLSASGFGFHPWTPNRLPEAAGTNSAPSSDPDIRAIPFGLASSIREVKCPQVLLSKIHLAKLHLRFDSMLKFTSC